MKLNVTPRMNVDADTTRWYREIARAVNALIDRVFINGREVLTDDRTYYVATTGSDNNNGLAESTPFLTIQKAVDTVCSIDVSVYVATIQIADGTYAQQVRLKRYIGGAIPVISGNATTPANVVISTSTGSCLETNADTGQWYVKNLKVQSTSGNGVIAYGLSAIQLNNIVFGQCVGNHMIAYQGGIITMIGNYAVSGGSSAGAHACAISGGSILTSTQTVTITGTPSFATAWVWSDRGAGFFDMYGMTFSGSATGARYILNLNSVCFTNGGGVSYFPGSISGTTATGGQYA